MSIFIVMFFFLIFGFERDFQEKNGKTHLSSKGISLLLVTVTTPISARHWGCGHTIVTCPCGPDSKHEIEVPIKLCRVISYEHYPPRSKCLPCIGIDPKRICHRFHSCRDCVSTKKSRCLSQNVDISTIDRKYCPRPLLLHHGEIRVDEETSPGGKMHYKCHDEYRLEGKTTRKCLDNFRWSGKPSRCVKKVSCKTPEMPLNGNIVKESNSFEYNEIVTYRCKKNFILIGAAKRTCLGDGSWSGFTPLCIPIISCQDPGIPRNATRIDTRPDGVVKNSRFPVGSTLKYKCADGYKLYGSSVQECVASGEWRGRQPACVVECGKIFQTGAHSIIGGGQLPREFIPWMAAIAVGASFRSTGINCGGSLINERWVVTAAHCVTIKDTKDTYSVDRIFVYLGKLNRTDRKDDPIVQKFEAADVYVHEDYDPSKLLNDIALIYLSKDAVINKFIRPICLPTSKESLRKHITSGMKGRVSGWGRTGEFAQTSETRLTAKVAVFDDNDCFNKVLRSKGYERESLNAAFCAGTRDVFYDKKTTHISDASLYDSGGGLAFQSCSTYEPTWYLEGVVSWGLKDGVGVYVRVFNFIDWIRSMM